VVLFHCYMKWEISLCWASNLRPTVNCALKSRETNPLICRVLVSHREEGSYGGPPSSNWGARLFGGDLRFRIGGHGRLGPISHRMLRVVGVWIPIATIVVERKSAR